MVPDRGLEILRKLPTTGMGEYGQIILAFLIFYVIEWMNEWMK